jgi:hypothetical protein
MARRHPPKNKALLVSPNTWVDTVAVRRGFWLAKFVPFSSTKLVHRGCRTGSMALATISASHKIQNERRETKNGGEGSKTENRGDGVYAKHIIYSTIRGEWTRPEYTHRFLLLHLWHLWNGKKRRSTMNGQIYLLIVAKAWKYLSLGKILI